MASNADTARHLPPTGVVLSSEERRGENASGAGGGGSDLSLLPPIHASPESPGARNWNKIRKQIQSGQYRTRPTGRQRFQRLQRQTSNVVEHGKI